VLKIQRDQEWIIRAGLQFHTHDRQRRESVSGGAGAPLEQKGMADVTYPDGSGVRGQSQLITGTVAAVDVSTVPAMVL